MTEKNKATGKEERPKEVTIFVEGELKRLSPLEERSMELLAQAKEVEITNTDSYKAAKKLKKEAVSHRVETNELRKSFTRKLDDIKSQFITRQDEVLAPSLQAENLLKDRIEEWEKARERERREEMERMQHLIEKLQDKPPKIDRKTGTPEDVKRGLAALKMELSLLDPKDRSKKAVKDVVAEQKAYYQEQLEFVTERIEQEKKAEELRLEEERLAEERKKLEQEKIDAQAGLEPKGDVGGIAPPPAKEDPEAAIKEEAKEIVNEMVAESEEKKTYLHFAIDDPSLLPREYLQPNLIKIHEDVQLGVIIDGVRVWEGIGDDGANSESA